MSDSDPRQRGDRDLELNTPMHPTSWKGWESWVLRFYTDARLVILLISLITVAGLTSVISMPRMEDPVLKQRVAMINTRLPGADATRVETLVTNEIEDRLRDIEEIKELRSTSRLGISTIVVELRDDVVDTDPVWSRVRSRLEDTIPRLPTDASRPEFDELEVRAYALILGLTWERDEPTDWRLLRRLAILLQDQLQDLTGTDTVDRFGDPGEEIRVSLLPERLASMGLSFRDVAARLSQHDAKQSAGLLHSARSQIPIKISNQFDNLDEIRATPLRQSNGTFVRLEDVATIGLEIPDPPARAARVAGRDAIVLGAMVRPTYRIDIWTEKVDRAIEDFAQTLPAGVKIESVLRQSDYVDDRLGSLLVNLFAGCAAVSLVILLVMGWRSAILVTMMLPLASFAVLFALRASGIPIHQMSITGLIIAIGLLIDNAIVVVDEVRRRLREGMEPTEAMLQTVRHLAVPLTGSTVTTALAFAPIALMPGPAGEFVGAIAVSVIFAIFASLALSMTLTAGAATRLLASEKEETRNPSASFLAPIRARVSEFYQRVLRLLIGRPAIGIGVAISAPVLGFAVFPQLNEQFFPPSGRNQFYLSVELSSTGALEETVRTSEAIDRIARELNIPRTDWFYGESAPQFYYNVIANRRGTSNFAQCLVTLNDDEDVTAVVRQLQQKIDTRITNARVLVRQLEQGPPFSAPIEARIFGPDLDQLQQLGERLAMSMARLPHVTYCQSDLSDGLPQVAFNVDADSARIANVDPTEIAEDLFASLEGSSSGTVFQDNEQIPVSVRMGEPGRRNLGSIASLDLILNGDTFDSRTSLGAISQVNLAAETSVISRLNRQRINEVSGFIVAGVLPSVVQKQLESQLAADGFVLPPGYELKFGGEGSKRDDAVMNLFSTVGVLMVCMVAILVLSFGSFRLAALIGLVAGLSTGLAFLALWLGGYPFGFMAIIGTMGLIGIAINDSIVVLAAIQANPRAALGELDAILHEVTMSTRHVVATSLTTVAGFAPLILDGGEFWPPMAVSVAGGVLGATFLALVLIPAVYRALFSPSRVLAEVPEMTVCPV